MKSRDYLFERKKREFFLFSFQFLFSTTINHIFYLSVEEMFARIVSKVNVNRLARFAHTEAKQVEQKMFSGVCTAFCSGNILIVFVILQAKECNCRFDPWELPTYILVYGGMALAAIGLKCAPETSTKNWAYKIAQEKLNKEHKN